MFFQYRLQRGPNGISLSGCCFCYMIFFMTISQMIGHVLSVCVSGSKDYQLVTWSRDQTLRIWRVDPQLQRVSVEPHREPSCPVSTPASSCCCCRCCCVAVRQRRRGGPDGVPDGGVGEDPVLSGTRQSPEHWPGSGPPAG